MAIESNAQEVLGRLAARLAGAQERVMSAAEFAFGQGLAQTAAWIQQNELSGQVLNQRTGRLSQSIGHPTVQRNGTALTGTLSTVWYGRIHEYGGTFAAHRKDKRGDNVLKSGKGRNPWHHLGIYTMHFPERAFVRPGIAANRDMIRQLLRDAIKSAI